MKNSENGNNNNQPIYLDVDGTNPDKLWCVLTGNQNGHKILRSADAGETWEDWSTATIAGQRVVSLAHQRGTNGGVYIGTTQAVYYRDAEMDDWLLYNTGLPMINVCTFMQADYCGGHIRTAGTRGVHQAEFYAPSEVLSGFMADRTRINLASPCQVSPIHFSAVPVALCEALAVSPSARPVPLLSVCRPLGPQSLPQVCSPAGFCRSRAWTARRRSAEGCPIQ